MEINTEDQPCAIRGCGPGDDEYMCNIHWAMWKEMAAYLGIDIWKDRALPARQEFIDEQGELLSACVWPSWV